MGTYCTVCQQVLAWHSCFGSSSAGSLLAATNCLNSLLTLPLQLPPSSQTACLPRRGFSCWLNTGSALVPTQSWLSLNLLVLPDPIYSKWLQSYSMPLSALSNCCLATACSRHLSAR